jgi:hypothetical protein
MKKKYYLIFFKETGIGLLNKSAIGFPMYRKKGKFRMTHAGDRRCLLNYFQAWYWYLRIKFGLSQGKDLFAYKQPRGTVRVKKMQ